MYIHIDLVQPEEILKSKFFLYSYGTHSFHSRRNNKIQSQLSAVPLKICLPSTCAAYSEMCPIKWPTWLTTAMLWSWQKTPTAFRVSVSKFYVTSFLWICSLTERYGDCLLRFLDHTQLDTDTVGWTVPNEWTVLCTGGYVHNTKVHCP